MSNPRIHTTQRFVPSGSRDNDPVLINGVPYTVIKGDSRLVDCPTCPELSIVNEGEQDEQFLTSVWTCRAETGIVVTVQADDPIQLEQLLYIIDSTPGAVVLSNVAPAPDSIVWGKVFDLLVVDNVLFPNDTVWLEPGQSGETGCLEAIMVCCDCPANPPITSLCEAIAIPENTFIVTSDTILNCTTFPNITEALAAFVLAGSPANALIWVMNNTNEPSDIVISSPLTILANPNVVVTLGDNITFNAQVVMEGGTYTGVETSVGLINIGNGGIGILRQNFNVNTGVGGSCVRTTGSGILRTSNGTIIRALGGHGWENLTTSVVEQYQQDARFETGDSLSDAIRSTSVSVLRMYHCQVEIRASGGVNAINFTTVPSLASLFVGNTFNAFNGTGWGIQSALAYTPALISQSTVVAGGAGDINIATITTPLGVSNDVI